VLRYRALAERWPHALESPLPLYFVQADVLLDGWLNGLRRNADGALASLQAVPGALAKEGAWKWHRLLRPYVLHVIAAACELPLTTLLVGEDRSLAFDPVPVEQAR
ncbi:hypothetical protein, partial [Bowmanella yangjiangensis]